MRSLFLVLSFIFLSFFSCDAFAGTHKYFAPPSEVHAAFQVLDQGLTNVMGFFEEASGSFTYDSDTSEISNIKIAISTDNLSTPAKDAGHDFRELLAPSLYPEMTFMATAPSVIKDGKAEIKGTLTLHGQSKPATFSAILNRREGDTSSLGLSLKGSFNRADFDMADPPEIPGRFGKDITLTLEIKAISVR
jgi:polyisoprenoid-binding protein YceI